MPVQSRSEAQQRTDEIRAFQRELQDLERRGILVLSDEQRRALELWLEGWSLCLAEMNFLRTGYRSQGLLDVHFVTDDDIAAHGRALRDYVAGYRA